jgi:hypothetical protein
MTMELPPSTAPTPPAAAPTPPVSAPTPPSTSPLPPATVRPRRSSSRILDLALILAAALAIGGVAFGVGRATAPAVSAANGTGTFRGANGFRPNGSFDPGAGPRGGFALGGGLSIDGTVTAVSGNAITLKLTDGREMTFTLDASTAYHQSTAASVSDVAVGDDVSVKLKGDRVTSGASPSAAPQLQASDVTVTR